MEYKLQVSGIDGDKVTMTTSMGYSETLSVGDTITIEIPDDANVQEVSTFRDEHDYELLKATAAHHAQDAHVADDSD